MAEKLRARRDKVQCILTNVCKAAFCFLIPFLSQPINKKPTLPYHFRSNEPDSIYHYANPRGRTAMPHRADPAENLPSNALLQLGPRQLVRM